MFNLLDEIIYKNRTYKVYSIGREDKDWYLGIGDPQLPISESVKIGSIGNTDLHGSIVTDKVDKLSWVHIPELYKDNIRNIPFELIKNKSKEILEFMYDHRIKSVEYELNNDLCIKYKYDINKKIFSMYVNDIEVISSSMAYDIINFK